MITIKRQPLDWTPLYNDNWVIFKSQEDNIYGEVSVGADKRRVVPYKNGDMSYNINNLLTPYFTLEDINDIPPIKWYTTTNQAGITKINLVTKDLATNELKESSQINLSWFKGVRQYDEVVTPLNDLEVLGSSYKTYFEGYPFWIDLFTKPPQGLHLRPFKDKITFMHNETGNIYSIKPTFNATSRIWFDKGFSNVNLDNMFELNRIENNLHIACNRYEEVAHLNVKRITHCKRGYYLKWLNRDGGFSTYLFDKDRRNEFRLNDKGSIYRYLKQQPQSNSFTNPYKSLGKEGDKAIEIEARVDNRQLRDFEDLVNSPTIYMWSETEAFKKGRWIDIDSSSFVMVYRKEKDFTIMGKLNLPRINM